jgi:outer membrane protein TolC
MKTIVLLATAATLAGCATFSADGGLGPVQQAATQHLNKDLAWARSDVEQDRIDIRVAELLRTPLTADNAVQLALLNHRGLQAKFHDIGLSEAALVQSTRLPNPGFSFGRFERGDEREIERSWHFSLARILTMPWRREAASQRLAATQASVAAAVLAHAADTRRAWVQAVAAQEGVRYSLQVMRAAEASAELAQRMQQVGNFSALQRAREQAFYADAALDVARAEQAERAAREKLTRLLGLWGAQTGFLLPERLPDLPAQARDLPDVERTAIAQRLDLQAARREAAMLAGEQSATRADRIASGLELGLARNSSNEAPTQRGWDLGFEIPLFDWGGAKNAAAEHRWRQAAQRATQTAIDARSEVREAYGAYRSAYDMAKHHREEIVPLRKQVLDQNVLRYNGMLIGVFDLLADARLQIASVKIAIEALRDFWLAEADLDSALVGKPMLSPIAGAASTMPAASDAH